MRLNKTTVLVMLLLACSRALAAGDTNAATNLVTGFELQDQFDTPQKIAFPATNILVLVVTDRKGSEQVGDWLAALRTYQRPITVRGLADLAGAPWFVHGRIRQHFRETYPQPVMLDWSGRICSGFKYQHDAANVLIISQTGTVLDRVVGPADKTNRERAFEALDQAISAPD